MDNATVPWGDKRTDRGVAHKMQVKIASLHSYDFRHHDLLVRLPEPDIRGCCRRRSSGNWPLGQQFYASGH